MPSRGFTRDCWYGPAYDNKCWFDSVWLEVRAPTPCRCCSTTTTRWTSPPPAVRSSCATITSVSAEPGSTAAPPPVPPSAEAGAAGAQRRRGHALICLCRPPASVWCRCAEVKGRSAAAADQWAPAIWRRDDILNVVREGVAAMWSLATTVNSAAICFSPCCCSG